MGVLMVLAYVMRESLSGGRGHGRSLISVYLGQYISPRITAVIYVSVIMPDL